MKLPKNPPKIRRGQLWRKRDTKNIVKITSTHNGKYFIKSLNGSRKGHAIPEKTLLLFWEKLS